MAEAIARQLVPRGVSVLSAGSNPSHVHPLAIRALEEIGIDTSALWSKSVGDVGVRNFDAVITLCEEEFCPESDHFLHALHWPLPDPAREGGGLEGFRQVRNTLRRRLAELFSAWYRRPTSAS